MIGIFILVAAMIVFITLMHTMMRLSVRAQQRALAALAAENKLEEIRDWADTGTNFQGSWSNWDAKDFTDPSFPGLRIRTEVADATLFSPCSEFEASYVDQRTLTRSCKKVKVTVRWDNDGGRPLSLLTLFGAPPRDPDANLLVAAKNPPTPASLTRTSSFTLLATARDTSGQPIEDMFFQWFTQPTSTNPGNGTVTPSTRDGREAVFVHQYGSFYIDGLCRVGASATYRGRALTGTTTDVQLIP
ncbi:MAG: hypothetical protein AB1758_08145 [Candidatus Eremiobacterota bacterium]